MECGSVWLCNGASTYDFHVECVPIISALAHQLVFYIWHVVHALCKHLNTCRECAFLSGIVLNVCNAQYIYFHVQDRLGISIAVIEEVTYVRIPNMYLTFAFYKCLIYLALYKEIKI